MLSTSSTGIDPKIDRGSETCSFCPQSQLRTVTDEGVLYTVDGYDSDAGGDEESTTGFGYVTHYLWKGLKQ